MFCSFDPETVWLVYPYMNLGAANGEFLVWNTAILGRKFKYSILSILGSLK